MSCAEGVQNFLVYNRPHTQRDEENQSNYTTSTSNNQESQKLSQGLPQQHQENSDNAANCHDPAANQRVPV